jgi:hypothetical protein
MLNSLSQFSITEHPAELNREITEPWGEEQITRPAAELRVLVQRRSSGRSSSSRGGGRSNRGWRPAVEQWELDQRWREEQQGMAFSGGAARARPEVEGGAEGDLLHPAPIFSATPAPDPVGSRMGRTRRGATLGAWASGTAWIVASDQRSRGSRWRHVGAAARGRGVWVVAMCARQGEVSCAPGQRMLSCFP